MNSLIVEKMCRYVTQLVPKMPTLGHFIRVYNVYVKNCITLLIVNSNAYGSVCSRDPSCCKWVVGEGICDLIRILGAYSTRASTSTNPVGVWRQTTPAR